MKTALLGIDVGTSACKVAAFDLEGRVLAQAAESYPVLYPQPGWAEQDPQQWWEAVCRALRRLWESGAVAPGEVAGVGIDGQSWSAIPLDKEGRALCNTPIWMDTRAGSLCQELEARVGGEKIFACSGNPLSASYTLPKVLWYKEHLPQGYDKAEKVLQSNGYLAFRLTGAVTQDKSQGYGWACYNVARNQWDISLCQELGVKPSLLPEIVSCSQVVGGVTPQAAQETGLLEGTPVVAGGLDAACGTLGAGVIHPGETQEQGDSSFQQLDREAEAVPPGCQGLVFLPYLAGERSPLWDIHAKGEYYGIDFSKTRAHFARACMEGVAYSLRHNLKVAQEAGASAGTLRAMGGAANSRLWTQIKADITGKAIQVPASDAATSLGAALLAGVGVGAYRDFDQAVAATVRVTREHTPNPEHRQAYEQGYRLYRQLYEDLKDTMRKEAL